MKFENKVAIITGAGGGMGSETARQYVKEGGIAVMVDLKAELAVAAAERHGIPADKYIALSCDISDEAAVKAVVDTVMEKYGRIDALVNAAGIPGPSARTEDYGFKTFKRVYEINVFGTYAMMMYVLPVMQAQKSGSIVNFGSVSGMFGYPYEIAYGSSKWAVIGMTKNAANENGANGVRVNSVSPGWVDTNMLHTVWDSYKDVGIVNSSDNITLGPMGRPATAEELVNAVIFLLSDEGRFCNGTNFLVDGGMTLG